MFTGRLKLIIISGSEAKKECVKITVNYVHAHKVGDRVGIYPGTARRRYPANLICSQAVYLAASPSILIRVISIRPVIVNMSGFEYIRIQMRKKTDPRYGESEQPTSCEKNAP
jgi:hypothetical protein